MSFSVRLEHDSKLRRTVQEALTGRLPEWFGRPESNLHYGGQAELLPGWVASVDGQDAGLLLLKRHGELSAEIYWMGVDPAYHRRGIGRAMVEAASRALRAEGRLLLFALTMHPDDPSEHYRRTRCFYEGLGFFLGVAAHGDPDDLMAWYVCRL